MFTSRTFARTQAFANLALASSAGMKGQTYLALFHGVMALGWGLVVLKHNLGRR